jgi:MbtH protein
MPESSERVYQVVVNDEEQYSIWPTGRAVPAGWHIEGLSGTEDECVAHIEQVWVDMRPKSLR